MVATPPVNEKITKWDGAARELCAGVKDVKPSFYCTSVGSLKLNLPGSKGNATGGIHGPLCLSWVVRFLR